MFIDYFIFNASFIWVNFEPKYDSVVENKSYHRGAISFITYIAFKISTYSNFFSFSYVTNLSYYGFTSHIMSTNSPSNFMCTTLSSGSDACRYAPRTSKLCTALPSWESINNDPNSASNVMVGYLASSCGIWLCWRIPYAHVLSLILLNRSSLISLTSLNALYVSWWDMIFASWCPKTSRLCNYLYSFNIATTDLFSYVFISLSPLSV